MTLVPMTLADRLRRLAEDPVFVHKLAQAMHDWPFEDADLADVQAARALAGSTLRAVADVIDDPR